MQTSEEAARSKWCPFANRLIEVQLGRKSSWKVANRNEDDEPACFCVATDCMAWRQAPDAPGWGWCGLVRE